MITLYGSNGPIVHLGFRLFGYFSEGVGFLPGPRPADGENLPPRNITPL